jgi:catechol 2,3-dioxygenase-like lactoylglutathione lyase family enzyme
MQAAAVLVISGFPCRAQAPTKGTELAGIAHVAIRVSDLVRSRDFYEKLGFVEAFAMDQDGTTTQSFVKINDRQFIELYPQREPSQAIGFMHVCFESGDLEGLNRFYIARGLSPNAVRRAGAGNLLFTMEGPEKQNIEYTQYMPGSRHTNDQGKHLGANRIAEEILAVGIEMQDPAPAVAFYKEKLAFVPVRVREPGQSWLNLPGKSGQLVVISQHAFGTEFQLFFSVTNFRRAGAQFKGLHLRFERHKSLLSVLDPDGNRIVFLKAGPV